MEKDNNNNDKNILQFFVFKRKNDEEFGRFFDETYKVWETEWTRVSIEFAKIIVPHVNLPDKGYVFIKLHHKYPNAVGSGKTSQYFAYWKKSSFWSDLFGNSSGERCEFNHTDVHYQQASEKSFEFVYELKL